MRTITRSILVQTFALLLTLGFFQSTGCSQPPSPSPPETSAKKELIVAIKEAPPFVMKHEDGTYYGIGIDLWRRVADRLQLR